MVEDTVFVRGEVFVDFAAMGADELRNQRDFVAVFAMVLVATGTEDDAIDSLHDEVEEEEDEQEEGEEQREGQAEDRGQTDADDPDDGEDDRADRGDEDFNEPAVIFHKAEPFVGDRSRLVDHDFPGMTEHIREDHERRAEEPALLRGFFAVIIEFFHHRKGFVEGIGDAASDAFEDGDAAQNDGYQRSSEGRGRDKEAPCSDDEHQ